LQRMPAVGEVWRCKTAELTVVSVCGPRLDQIQIRLLSEASGDRTLEENREVAGKGRSNSGLKDVAQFDS
jgi:hypothetical protein